MHNQSTVSDAESFSKLCSSEQGMLRTELSSLKNCQITFLTYAVTGTGILFGLAVNLAGTDDAPFPSLGAFYLIPLIILLPFWWIFFDKATTITRIVGYYRILENLIIYPHHKALVTFLGWENALAEFRHRYGSKDEIKDPSAPQSIPKGLSDLLLLQVSQKYWMLTFYTFTSLSLLSLMICVLSLWNAVSRTEIIAGIMVLLLGLITGLVQGKNVQRMTAVCLGTAIGMVSYFAFVTHPTGVAPVLMIVAGFLVGLSISRNFVMVWRLTWGDHSYFTNHEVWKSILYKKSSDSGSQEGIEGDAAQTSLESNSTD